MNKWSKKRKLAALILFLILAIAGYCLIVFIKAYSDTPAIISQALASDKMVLRLEDFPEGYLDNLLAVEDPSFFTHNGVDLQTPGAGLTTITQGLAKRYYFDSFKPGLSKIKQTLCALALNRRVDKRTQLRLFVNTVYLGTINGQEINGFSDGARAYFGKDFSQLTKDEYLSLVAMIVGPDEYNVLKQPEKNAERVKRIKRLLAGACQPQSNRDVFYESCREDAPEHE